MVKFIHAADIHLDSPFKGLHAMPESLLKKVRQSTFDAMERITNCARSEKVDFVIISGDIYDYDDRSILAQSFFRNQMLILEKEGIPVFIIHGNHDFSDEDTNQLEMPASVHVFKTEPETKVLTLRNGETVALTGFSYGKKWITERKIVDYPNRSSDAQWHVGLLHGSSEGTKSEHANYAPFTLQDLRSKGYDYWALGHIHIQQKLSDSPLVYYAGNPQGRNKKETGAKGFLMVELTSEEKKVTPVIASRIQWEIFYVDAGESKTLGDILQKIEEDIAPFKESEINVILSISMTLHADLDPILRKKVMSGELLESLQQGSFQEPFVWVNDLVFIAGEKEKKASAIAGAFQKEWFRAVDEMNNSEEMSDILEDFFRNAPSMSMLPLHDSSYREDILNEAIQLIYTAVGNEE